MASGLMLIAVSSYMTKDEVFIILLHVATTSFSELHFSTLTLLSYLSLNSCALSIVLFNTITSLDPCSNKAATTALLAPPAPKTNDAFYAVVLSTTHTTPSLTSLTIGKRTGAATIDLHGEHLGVLKRDGTKGFIAFNKA